MHLVGMITLLILLSLGPGHPIPGARISQRLMVLVMTMVLVSGILSVWKGYIGLITWVNIKIWLSTSK
jgi:hypothetical protein